MNIATIPLTAPVKLQLKEMYIRHGFHVVEKQGFLFISFASPEKVNIITKYVQSNTPLTFDQVKTIHEHFLKLGKAVKCHQYRIICTAGFRDEALFFQDLNVALSGREYLDSLQNISHIELYSHNDIAYSRLCSMLQTNDKVCIIQPTGTGKSLIISKFITDLPESKFVVLAPGKFVIGEIKKHLLNVDHAEFFTYSKLTNLTVKEVKNLKPDYIIVDEFHRCGAEEWGAGVELLIKTYPDAKLIGTTATHIRYLDDKRNMADELFEGNIAHHLTLSKALALGILPTPKYVSALYKFDEEYLRVKKSIALSMAEDKKVLLERLNKIKLEFENTSSIPQILQEHLTGNIQKIIVFTKDIKHLRKHKEMVLDWFKSIGYNNIFAYEVHSENDAKNKVIFKDFEQLHDRLDVMFSVNMLNEGIHVKGVNCIIMLRDTESPIIYYQQMGRCLTVGAEKPLIFDLVNNFANIRHRNLVNEVNEEFGKLKEIYKSKGIGYDEISFEIIDKVRDIKELLDEVETTADSWNVFFDKLEAYKAKFGNCDVPSTYEDSWFANKVTRTRIDFKNKTLRLDLIERLNELNFTWSFVNAEESWEIFFKKLEAFKEEHGHCNIPSTYDDKWLTNKCGSVRFKFKKNILNPILIERLNQLGFVFYYREEINRKFISKLQCFKNEFGHCNVPSSYEDKWLANKVLTIRQSYKKGKLNEITINLLKDMGFRWEYSEERNSLFFKKLEEFYKIKGHCNVTDSEDKYLCSRISQLRINYRKGKLDNSTIVKLNDLNIDWNPKQNINKSFISKLKEYYAIHGNCNIPESYPDKWLYRKVNYARYEQKKGTLNKKLYEELNNLGFEWAIINAEESWEIFFKKLEAFKEEHGHCRVPLTYKDSWLAIKLAHAREKLKKGKLKPDIIDNLNKLGVIFNTSENISSESKTRFISALKQFKSQFGNCNVPSTYEDKWLANKVGTIRKEYKKSMLDQTFIDILEKMGFEWNLLEKKISGSWAIFFDKLEIFKSEYGHCNVFESYPDKWLVSKVLNTRQMYKNNKLEKKVIDRLTQIGFLWRIK